MLIFYWNVLTLIDMKIFTLMCKINYKWESITLEKQIKIIKRFMVLIAVCIASIIVILIPLEITTIFSDYLPEYNQPNSLMSGSFVIWFAVLGLFLMFVCVYCYHIISRIYIKVV